MAEIKSLDVIAKKWATVTPQRQSEYEDGVRNPKRDWAAATTKAAGAQAKAVQAAISAKSFEKGVAKAGTAKWQEKTLSKGPTRWAQGVSLSESDYQSGFAPFREVIARTALPPRGPKGDPSNINRVAVLAKALHDAKVAGA